jgi:hypothetical protein
MKQKAEPSKRVREFTFKDKDAGCALLIFGRAITCNCAYSWADPRNN